MDEYGIKEAQDDLNEAAMDSRRRKRLLTLLERLNAENVAYWSQTLEGAPPHLTSDSFKRLNADNVRLQAENVRLRDRLSRSEVAYERLADENERLVKERTMSEKWAAKVAVELVEAKSQAQKNCPACGEELSDE